MCMSLSFNSKKVLASTLVLALNFVKSLHRDHVKRLQSDSLLQAFKHISNAIHVRPKDANAICF